MSIPNNLNMAVPFLEEDTGLPQAGILATIRLLEEGGTVPFIARYRKEQTGELDEVQIRTIEERYQYFKDLSDRKETVLKSMADQGKLTPELEKKIRNCLQKTELEDLYLPYKPKRRTKAMIAREQGLEPLADWLLQEEAVPDLQPAETFVWENGGVESLEQALAGAGYIIAERIAEDAGVRAMVRQQTWDRGVLRSRVTQAHVGSVSKFEMYYDYREPLKEVPSHRMLAMRRGEKEEVLRLAVEAPVDEILKRIRQRFVVTEDVRRPILEGVVEDAYQRLLAPSIEVELRLEAKKAADQGAIQVFVSNLRSLLLASPAGSRRVLGVDPGLRTGSKLAAVDDTGRFLDQATIYPHTGKGKVAEARKILLQLIEHHDLNMVAIGNGTAGREMEQFVRETLREAALNLTVVLVNEAGASVYSASEVAREEFPDLDLTVRGAISIARRLQDPLAELVKIDPKAIGVGQYQHDVSQTLLRKSLDDVVESCVNYVGVDLNMASAALLSYVSGIGEGLARGIVAYRDREGPFATRQQLLSVPRFGAKAFEQSAGFLRIRQGENPLDNTAVHPERYALVETMAQDLQVSLAALSGDGSLVSRIDLPRYQTTEIGLPTLNDIVEELLKPGRDPREAFQTATFREDVNSLEDLQEGMTLQGTVTNVTAFGAFVDIGVHQDGLVHISELADKFIKDPQEMVSTGQVVKVRVLSVDSQRKRIALSMKQESAKAGSSGSGRSKAPKKKRPVKEKMPQDAAAALAAAGFRVKRSR